MGLYDRGTGSSRFYVVGNDRTANKLLPIIQATVDSDDMHPTRIMTDGWRAYEELKFMDYHHIVVNHSEGFGRGSLTTNHIESLWS